MGNFEILKNIARNAEKFVMTRKQEILCVKDHFYQKKSKQSKLRNKMKSDLCFGIVMNKKSV